MSNVEKFIVAREEQTETLFNGGTVVSPSGEQITFEDGDVVLEPVSEEEQGGMKLYKHTVEFNFGIDGDPDVVYTFGAINNNPNAFSDTNKFPLCPVGSTNIQALPIMYDGNVALVSVGMVGGSDRTVVAWLVSLSRATVTVEEYNP